MNLARLAALDGPDDKKTTATQAVHALTQAGVNDHAIAAHWKKVYDAPQGDVRALVAELEAAKPEMHAHILTEFGKGKK